MRCTCRSSPQPRRAARDIAALDVGLADVSEVRAVQPTEASLRTGVVALMPPDAWNARVDAVLEVTT